MVLTQILKEISPKMIGVYKIKNPKGKVYIGSSIDIKKRFNYYRTTFAPNQPLLGRSFKKYGIESHDFEILCECSIDDLFQKEREFGEAYKSLSDFGGLNIKLPGHGDKKMIFSEIIRNKMSEYAKKRTYSEETRMKFRIAKIGLYKNGNHPSARLVLCLEDGVYYDTIKEAAIAYGLKRATLNARLLGLSGYDKLKQRWCLV